jgi:hypothetical protein
VATRTSVFSMLLSYRYLYMRTRGHEASPSQATTQPTLASTDKKSPAHKSTCSLGGALPFDIQERPKIVQLSPPKEVFWVNAFFPFLSLPFPFPMTNFIPIAVARALADFSEKHSKTTKNKKAFLNEMQPGGALALASLRTFFAVRS